MKKPKVSKTRTDPHTGEKVKLSTEAWKARQAESDANWEAQQGKEHKNEVIRDQRRIAYPKVGDQLDDSAPPYQVATVLLVSLSQAFHRLLAMA